MMLCAVALLLAAGVAAEQERQLLVDTDQIKEDLLNSYRKMPVLCPPDNLFPSAFDQFCYEHCPHDKPERLGALCLSECPSGCTGVAFNCACPPEKCGELLESAAESATCEVAKDCDVALTCEVAATCDVAKSCNVAKTCNKPKTCNVAATCDVAKSCNVAKTCNKPKTCNKAKTCNVAKSCNVAKTCNKPKTCNVAKSCKEAKSCRTKSCEGQWWNPTCWWSTVTDGAKCGWNTVTDAAKCGTQAVTDGAQCGWNSVTDGAQCGWSHVTSGAECGWNTVTDAATCGTEAVADGATCGWNSVTDGAQCGWSHVTSGAECGWNTVTDAAKCGMKAVADGAKCGWNTVTDGAQCGWSHVTSGAECGWTAVKDGAQCGWNTVQDAAECGTKVVTDSAVCGTKVVANSAQCAAAIGGALLQCTFPRASHANTPHYPNLNKDLKGSFDNRPRTVVSDEETFTMAFLGDPQLGYPTVKPDKGLTRVHDRKANLDIMRSITAASKTSTNFKGLALVGDLTEFGKQEEVQEFTKIYGPTSDNDEHSWSGKVWPMLGNHDYANNAGDKWFDGSHLDMLTHFALFENSGAAEFMTAWMRSVAGGWDNGESSWSSFGGTDHYDFESMAYGWSLGNHRFVATHNYPSYTAKDCQLKKCRDTPGLGLDDSFDFIEDELAVSESRGQAITLLIHDYGQHFCGKKANECDAQKCNKTQECEEFHKIINGSNVVAIMTGHIHERVGPYSNVGELSGSLEATVVNKWGNRIPLIGTGAPGLEQWTKVVYEGCRMTVNVMASNGTTLSTDSIANCASTTSTTTTTAATTTTATITTIAATTTTTTTAATTTTTTTTTIAATTTTTTITTTAATTTSTKSKRNAWRILATKTSSGWAWDVRRLQFLTAGGEILPSDKCQVITSRDCCPGYTGDNAFKNRGIWGGRRTRWPHGAFFIGLECSTDMPVTQVRLNQGGHFASNVVVQKLDSNNVWTEVATNSGVPKNRMVTLFPRTRRLQPAQPILV